MRAGIFAGAVALAIGFFCWSTVEQPGFRQPTGYPQLVGIQQLPDDAEICPPAAPISENLFAALQDGAVHAAGQESGTTGDVSRAPVRTIRDMDPIYSAIAVDTRFDEVILQDFNTWGIRVFNRLDNTPPGVAFTEPKRVIQGPKTDIQFNNGLYIDPKNSDIYSVESDTGDKVVVFPRGANGDVAAARILKTPHRGFGLAVNEEKEELYVAVEYPPQVATFRKAASGDEKPLRVLEGESTRLSDTHGIAVDVKNKLMFVNNWGNVSDYQVAGTGRFELPSIAIYALDAQGDSAPLGVIQGPKTQLNWPGQMAVEPESGDLYIANDVGHSVLVFRGTDKGDVAPARTIKGNKTGLRNPSGVFIDTKNRELWVSNFGNSSATVYPLTANGDVAPLRTIRSAPANKVGLNLGKTEAVAYDSKRDEILVPN